MNSYKLTLRFYNGNLETYYIKAKNQGDAFNKAHDFITQYDGCCEIIPERISKKYMAEHGLAYSDEKELLNQAWCRNQYGVKTEQMNKAIKKVMEIGQMTRPNSTFYIRYIRMTEERLQEFSDWDMKRFHFHVRDEYITVSNGEEHLLYCLNVSGNSVMQSIAELTDLLAGKGW